MLVIIDLLTDLPVNTVSSGKSVLLPGDRVAMAVKSGDVMPFEDETGVVIANYLFLEPVVVPEGAGPTVTDDPPVYDPVAGAVTIRRVLSVDTRPIAAQRADKIVAAQSEAEKRIDAGILVGGVTLRCDDRSVSRIHGMMARAQRGNVPIPFKTSAGEAVLIATALEAEALFDAASGHVAAMLAASSVLQDEINAMNAATIAALDVTAAIHW